MNWRGIGLLTLGGVGLALTVHGAVRYNSRFEQDRREDAAYQAFVDAVSEKPSGKVTEAGLAFLDLVDDTRDERVPQVVCYVRQAVVTTLLAAGEGVADNAARDLHRLNETLSRLVTAPARGSLMDADQSSPPVPAVTRARLDPSDCSGATAGRET